MKTQGGAIVLKTEEIIASESKLNSALLSFYAKVINLSPHFRKFSKRFVYQSMVRFFPQQDWTFMNYGYAIGDEDFDPPLLDTVDEANRLQIQLYFHLVKSVPLEGLKILDIGCGRGGGPDYVKRYLRVKTIVGLDFSEKAMAFCARTHSNLGVAFLAGDAEALPFPERSFDAVLNVESSHCYSQMDQFLSEVKRVLRPGGYFLFTDFRDKKHLDPLKEQLQRSGLALLQQTDITPNIIQALEFDNARKHNLIVRGVPKLLRKIMKEIVGCKGTRIYERFKRGKSVYWSYVFQKTAV